MPEMVGETQGKRTGVEGVRQGVARKRLQPRPQEPQRQGGHYPPATAGTGRIHSEKRATHRGDRGGHPETARKGGEMTAGWKTVKLGNLLSRTGKSLEADPSLEYSEITVRLWGKGVIERGRVTGAQVNGRRFVARTGNFIASRIDARNGAMGLVPESLDGALVTNDFPLFEANKECLDLDYLGWLSKTAGFVELCLRASEGTTNRVRLKEERFLNLEIPLPPLAEQRRIVARIEALVAQIDEARRLRKETMAEAEAIFGAEATTRLCEANPRRRMDEICTLITDGTHQTPRYTDDGYAFLSAQNVKPFRFMPDNYRKVSLED